MPTIDPNELTRQAQIKQLGGTAGTSNTMPAGSSPFEGFDFSREQNVQKSAKDAFADLAKKAGPAPLNDKSALGSWFTEKIAPGMNALGHQVQSVDGDKFRFKNWQGDYNVDFGRGAGADGGALAWQAEDANAPAPMAGGGMTSPNAPVIGANPALESGSLAKIMAELQAAQEGAQSPAEREAMMQLLQQV